MRFLVNAILVALVSTAAVDVVSAIPVNTPLQPSKATASLPTKNHLKRHDTSGLKQRRSQRLGLSSATKRSPPTRNTSTSARTVKAGRLSRRSPDTGGVFTDSGIFTPDTGGHFTNKGTFIPGQDGGLSIGGTVTASPPPTVNPQTSDDFDAMLASFPSVDACIAFCEANANNQNLCVSNALAVDGGPGAIINNLCESAVGQ